MREKAEQPENRFKTFCGFLVGYLIFVFTAFNMFEGAIRREALIGVSVLYIPILMVFGVRIFRK
jgi:hypothetical protein